LASVFFSFLIIYSWYDSFGGGSARRRTQTQNKRRQTSCLELDLNPRSKCLSRWRQFMP
jgi:hypothetical protein